MKRKPTAKKKSRGPSEAELTLKALAENTARKKERRAREVAAESERERRKHAALSFCLQVIRERQNSDSRNASLWKLRERVAVSCLSLWDHKMKEGIPRDYDSTEEDKELILQTHPLLADGSSVNTSGLDKNSQWYREIRDKVDRYSTSVKKNRK